MNNIVYIDILIETLEKKVVLLKKIIDISNFQSDLMDKGEDVESAELDRTFDNKDVLIGHINSIDNGFEQIFERTKVEISQNSKQYKTQIQELQKLIGEVTECSVRIQAIEQRNKVKMERYFATRRNKIKEFNVTNKMATNYYKNMADRHKGEAYFLDKKK